MIPMNAWGSNLRNQIFVLESEWDRLRRETYSRANKRCEVCWGQGSAHPVECHEQWHFDEATGVQSLRGLVALCPTCHQATHFGHSTRRNPTMADMLLRRHLANTNGWTQEQVDNHVAEANAACQRLHRVEWSLNLTVLEREYSDLLTPRTQGLLEVLHTGHDYGASLPMDVPQPRRLGVLLPPREPRTHEAYPWERDWVDGSDCSEVFVAMLGEIVPGQHLRAWLDSKHWAGGMRMSELRQEVLEWVLAPLVEEHAGNATGFFEALEESPLVPLALRGKRSGLWVVAYGLRAEMHWKVKPSRWVIRAERNPMHWTALSKSIGFDPAAHDAVMEAWSARFNAIYTGQLIRMYDIDVLDRF